MSDREFVDTNLLIYAFDRTAGAKRTLAIDLLERLWEERCGCASIQVLQEFYVTATKKLGMQPAAAARQIARLGAWTIHRPSFEDVMAAIEIHQGGQIAFWDAMVVRSAIKLSCAVLWSEDLNDGQLWDGTVVRNPFLAAGS